MNVRTAATAALLLVLAGGASAQTTVERYIVKFRPGRSARAEAAVLAAGGTVALRLGPQSAVAAYLPPAAAEGLAHNPNIEYIESDAIREPYALWSDRTTGGETLPYGVQMVQADLISSPNPGNRSVCIIDSGYSQQHADLKEADVTANVSDPGAGTWDFDSCGHGTHVAGTVAAIAGNGTGVVGVTPGVRLHIIKVFGDDNLAGANCKWTYSSTLIDAVNKCEAAGANVVSMSLGGGVRSRTEDAAFAASYQRGVLSIAAAGNGGSRRISYPAGYASVVSVAAVDADENVASFSQFNADVELAAPGVAVLSTVPYLDLNTLTAGGTTWSGGRIDGGARTDGVGGSLANGGLCTSAGAWAGQVVVCQRGSISFADKVKNVQAGGGVAAVIYNNVASDPTCGVFSGTLGTRPRTDIAAIALSCADGAAAVAAAGTMGTVVSRINAPDSGYEAWQGTSMATPHVSAVAALVWSCDPGRTASEIRGALTATARDKGTAGLDTYYGHGIVQAKAALLSLGLGSCTVR